MLEVPEYSFFITFAGTWRPVIHHACRHLNNNYSSRLWVPGHQLFIILDSAAVSETRRPTWIVKRMINIQHYWSDCKLVIDCTEVLVINCTDMFVNLWMTILRCLWTSDWLYWGTCDWLYWRACDWLYWCAREWLYWGVCDNVLRCLWTGEWLYWGVCDWLYWGVCELVIGFTEVLLNCWVTVLRCLWTGDCTAVSPEF